MIYIHHKQKGKGKKFDSADWAMELCNIRKNKKINDYWKNIIKLLKKKIY